jgi:hypothetical protein
MAEKRNCSILVTALTPTTSAIGVQIWTDSDTGKVTIAPDEARTIALRIEGDDPEAAADLCKAAMLCETMIAKSTDESSVIPARPAITGANALADWVRRHRLHFRAAYKQAGKDAVIIAHPATESLDDPPGELWKTDLEGASNVLRQVHLRSATQAAAGRFNVMATCGQGRFCGTFLGELPVDEPGDVLPEVVVKAVPVRVQLDNPSDN